MGSSRTMGSSGSKRDLAEDELRSNDCLFFLEGSVLFSGGCFANCA